MLEAAGREAEWEDRHTVFFWGIYGIFAHSERNAEVVIYPNINKHKECFFKVAWSS